VSYAQLWRKTLSGGHFLPLSNRRGFDKIQCARDFSVTADNAFKIKNGEFAFPLKPCTVAGNLYQALNHVIAIGNDSKNFENSTCPSIIVDKIVVST
jgi:predicted Zn-dependent protease